MLCPLAEALLSKLMDEWEGEGGYFMEMIITEGVYDIVIHVVQHLRKESSVSSIRI